MSEERATSGAQEAMSARAKSHLHRQTIVAFHAHPDDEALLTGGTLAKLAAQGHRVVLVTATAGALGLTEGGNAELGARRVAELRRSAATLGCARVECLDYPDSGWSTEPGFVPAEGSFARLPLEDVALRLAEILREEDADVLTTYDSHGGYGHLDHVRVHEVGRAAADLAGTPRVLEATIDRTLLARGVAVLQALHLVPQGTTTEQSDWFSGRAEITHKIGVRSFARQKKAALACHRSQAVGGSGPRTAAILLALPRPLFALVCGSEWFVEAGARPAARPLADLLEPAQAVVAA